MLLGQPEMYNKQRFSSKYSRFANYSTDKLIKNSIKYAIDGWWTLAEIASQNSNIIILVETCSRKLMNVNDGYKIALLLLC